MDTDNDAYTDSDADGYHTQFGIYIGTNEVEFNSFSLLLYISITICIGPSVAFLHTIVQESVLQCKHTRIEIKN